MKRDTAKWLGGTSTFQKSVSKKDTAQAARITLPPSPAPSPLLFPATESDDEGAVTPAQPPRAREIQSSEKKRASVTFDAGKEGVEELGDSRKDHSPQGEQERRQTRKRKKAISSSAPEGIEEEEEAEEVKIQRVRALTAQNEELRHRTQVLTAKNERLKKESDMALQEARKGEEEREKRH